MRCTVSERSQAALTSMLVNAAAGEAACGRLQLRVSAAPQRDGHRLCAARHVERSAGVELQAGQQAGQQAEAREDRPGGVGFQRALEP